jgi:hypothetical protein
MLVLVVAMFAGHITELFDQWDHTMQTGRDADYTIVMIAAAVGLCLIGIRKIVSVVLASKFAGESAPLQIVPFLHWLSADSSAESPSPPLSPIPIRI